MNAELSFRDILKNKFQIRNDRNRRYSLRAFAKDLKISPALLSQLLNGKRGLSNKLAREIAKGLGLDEQEQNYFCDLVVKELGRSEEVKTEAHERIENFHRLNVQKLSLESFSLIYDWYNFALLELSHTKDFVNSLDWISKKLKVPKELIKTSTERLVNLGLLEITPEGKWVDTEAHLATPSGFSFSYLRKFHKQLMEKAIAALETQTVNERDITSLIVSIDSSRLPEAKKKIAEFKKEFIKEFNNQEQNKDAVYCLGIQLFNLTKDESIGEIK